MYIYTYTYVCVYSHYFFYRAKNALEGEEEKKERKEESEDIERSIGRTLLETRAKERGETEEMRRSNCCYCWYEYPSSVRMITHSSRSTCTEQWTECVRFHHAILLIFKQVAGQSNECHERKTVTASLLLLKQWEKRRRRRSHKNGDRNSLSCSLSHSLPSSLPPHLVNGFTAFTRKSWTHAYGCLFAGKHFGDSAHQHVPECLLAYACQKWVPADRHAECLSLRSDQK